MIPFKDIQMEHDEQKMNDGHGTIGKGSTSKVYKAKWKKQDVAVKLLITTKKKKRKHNERRQTQTNWSDLTLMFRESILSSTIQHPNIVLFHGASLTNQAFYLITEYCEFGDLQQIVVENKWPDNPNIRSIYQRLFYLNDIARGMKFMHSNRFVHRDLKTANVVVSYSGRKYVAKICAFGVSRRIDDFKHDEVDDDDVDTEESIAESIHKKTTDFNIEPIEEIDRTVDVGTPAFLAPEILMKLVKKKGWRIVSTDGTPPLRPKIHCDSATDVYSYGLIVYSLITGKLPYKGFKAMEMIVMIKEGRRLEVSDEEWQQWSPYVNKISHLKLLLSSSWSQHATQRPSFAQICQLIHEI